MLNNNLNLVFVGVSAVEGMAGTKRVKNFISHLKKNKIVISNIINTHSKDEIQRISHCDNVRYMFIGNKIPVLGIFVSLIIGLVTLIILRKRKYKNILYNYGSPDIKNILYLVFAKLIGYRIVIDIVEDVEFVTDFKGPLSKIRFKSSQLFLKRIYLFAYACIVISNHLLYKLNNYSKGRIPVYLIPVSVDFCKIIDSKQRPIESNLRIFYGGSFGTKDGIDILIGAFERLISNKHSLELIICGKGSDRDEKRLFEQVNKSSAKRRIKFLGFLAEDEYYKELYISHIFCMTRINTEYANAGFPFKLGEFLATGKAVIASEIGDVPLYLTDKQNALLIDPDSIDQLYNAILYLINNPQKISEIGGNGYATARKYFNAAEQSLILLDILRRI